MSPRIGKNYAHIQQTKHVRKSKKTNMALVHTNEIQPLRDCGHGTLEKTLGIFVIEKKHPSGKINFSWKRDPSTLDRISFPLKNLIKIKRCSEYQRTFGDFGYLKIVNFTWSKINRNNLCILYGPKYVRRFWDRVVDFGPESSSRQGPWWKHQYLDQACSTICGGCLFPNMFFWGTRFLQTLGLDNEKKIINVTLGPKEPYTILLYIRIVCEVVKFFLPWTI